MDLSKVKQEAVDQETLSIFIPRDLDELFRATNWPRDRLASFLKNHNLSNEESTAFLQFLVFCEKVKDKFPTAYSVEPVLKISIGSVFSPPPAPSGQNDPSLNPSIICDICHERLSAKDRNLHMEAHKDKCATSKSAEPVQQTSPSLVPSPPMSSRHNNPSLYPSIVCVICNEWISARNRNLHMEAHLKYRPYMCTKCGYSARKHIIVEAHVKKNHGGDAVISSNTDEGIEKEAKRLGEQSIQQTQQKFSPSSDEKNASQIGPIKSKIVRDRIPNKSRESRVEVLRDISARFAPSARDATRDAHADKEGNQTSSMDSLHVKMDDSSNCKTLISLLNS